MERARYEVFEKEIRMLAHEEIEKKLFDLAEDFNEHMRQGKYKLAVDDYNTAFTVAMFVEMLPEKRVQLFGTRQQDPPIEGAFQEQKVLKAQEEYIIMGRTESAAAARRKQQNRKYRQ